MPSRAAYAIAWLILILGSTSHAGASSGPDARVLLRNAIALAQVEQKPMFVEFSGAPCVWCRELDALLAGPPVKRFMDSRFVTLKLWALDPDEQKEVPGAESEMLAFSGGRCGIPFYVVLTSNGQKHGVGCGFPQTMEEADRFVDLIASAVPQLDQGERSELSSWVGLRVRQVARRREGWLSWTHLRASVSRNLVAGGVALFVVGGVVALTRRRRTRS
jgi:hypothetical protein